MIEIQLKINCEKCPRQIIDKVKLTNYNILTDYITILLKNYEWEYEGDSGIKQTNKYICNICKDSIDKTTIKNKKIH